MNPGDGVLALLMAQAPVLPVLVPALAAVLLLGLGDHGGDSHDSRSLGRNRALSLAAVLLGLVVSVSLLGRAAEGELMVYRMGNWPAPFGIVLVVDRLSALMLVLTSVVALPVLVYASGGWDAHGRHFHALFQFQLMGLNGAFVTGDLFNLFVFFEVLLIASYVLLVHGLGVQRLRVGLHYVVLNLAASALFLLGLALIYGSSGTLNMADLAMQVPNIGGTDGALLTAGALLLLVVFGFKAALAPLSLWLPATYAAASAPVAALFAIMTKVGVYAILRVHGVVFGDGAGALADGAAPAAGAALNAAQALVLPAALASGLVGVLGALSARTLTRLVAWLTVASVGTILATVGQFNVEAWGAGLYYLVHSTLVMAALFMLAELVGAQRGPAADRLEPASPVAQPALLGTLLLLAAASGAGLPPMPGFIGKVLVLQAASPHPWAVAIWGVVLFGGFLTLMGLARAGSVLFWHVVPGAPGGASGTSTRLLTATVSLIGASVVLAVAAEPVADYTRAAARQLTDRAAYARAVLGDGPEGPTVRPYTGERPALDGHGRGPADAGGSAAQPDRHVPTAPTGTSRQ